MAAPNPPTCRLCHELGHRTKECPNLEQSEDDSFQHLTEDEQRTKELQERDLMRTEDARIQQRKTAPKNMDVDLTKGRGKGPAARGAAAMGSDERPKKPEEPPLAAVRGRGAVKGSGGFERDPRSDHGGAHFDLSEEGTAATKGSEAASSSGLDRLGGELSVLGINMERRPDLQHPEEHREPPAHLQLEEVGMAVEGEGSYPAGVQREGNLEEECEMAERSPGERDREVMGTLRSYEAATEVQRFYPPSYWRRLAPHRGLMQKFKKGMEQAREHQVDMVQLTRGKENYILLELFAGCARLTSTATERKGWEALTPVDIIYGQDLKNPKTQKEVMKLIRRVKPDLVTMSPRCGPWSQMQRINPNIDKVMEDRKEDIPLWRFCREVWDEQDRHGRLALTENPQQSAALTMDFMMERPNLHRAVVPQCAFGLVDVANGKPHQKMTAFDVNDLGMRDALMEGAMCNHSPEEHQQIEGNAYYLGKWVRRSALAAKWPEKLCKHILRAAERAWEKCDEKAPQKLSEGREPGESHYILPVEVHPTPEGELRRQLEKADWRGGQYDYVFFEGKARQGPREIRQALAHLHVVLGHPSEERLTRMLLISGCSPQIVDMAKGIRCQICQAVRPPGAEPKVNINRPNRFNQKILGDSFFIWDAKGERFNVTHLIDGLTEYHVGCATKQVGAEATCELLQNRWCSVFGPPEVLQTDGGKEFQDVIHKLTKLLDFRHEVVPAGAKWRQGQVERHGAIVKLMLMRVIATLQISGSEDMKLAVSSCFSAKNRMCNRMGMSPMQAVTGKNTTVPASVMEQLCSGQVRCAINEELEVKDALRKAERIRAAAIDSFNWVDSNEVLRKALNSRSRPPKLESFQEGMTVYVHEPPPSRRGQARRLQDHTSWDGPGLVVCV